MRTGWMVYAAASDDADVARMLARGFTASVGAPSVFMVGRCEMTIERFADVMSGVVLATSLGDVTVFAVER